MSEEIMGGATMLLIVAVSIFLLVIRDEWRKIQPWWKKEQKWKKLWQ